jgi:thiamine-phosphate pyrophosphorylase
LTVHLPRFYAIVDVDVCARVGREPAAVARGLLSAGVTCLQLRAKSWESGPMLDLARALVAEAGSALVIVNDRADVAAMAGASGVHVGQHDLAPADARRVVGPDVIVGLSTHTDEQLRAALTEPVSYVAIGPVHATATKDTGYDPIGLEGVRGAARLARERGLPLVAIGGITLERAPDVISAGADSVAVAADLLQGGDPAARAGEFLRALG